MLHLILFLSLTTLSILTFCFFFLKLKFKREAMEHANLKAKHATTIERLVTMERVTAHLRSTSHDLSTQNADLKKRIRETEQGERQLYLFEIIGLEPAGIRFYAPAFMNTKTGTLSPVAEEWRIIDREVVFTSMMCEGKTPILHPECCVRGIQHLGNPGVVTLFGEDYQFPSGNPSELKFSELQLVM